jgi:hypothetical protein
VSAASDAVPSAVQTDLGCGGECGVQSRRDYGKLGDAASHEEFCQIFGAPSPGSPVTPESPARPDESENSEANPEDNPFTSSLGDYDSDERRGQGNAKPIRAVSRSGAKAATPWLTIGQALDGPTFRNYQNPNHNDLAYAVSLVSGNTFETSYLKRYERDYEATKHFYQSIADAVCRMCHEPFDDSTTSTNTYAEMMRRTMILLRGNYGEDVPKGWTLVMDVLQGREVRNRPRSGLDSPGWV